MTPAQIRELADNLPHDNAGVCDTSSEVLWACADLVEAATNPSIESVLWAERYEGALKRIEEISP